MIAATILALTVTAKYLQFKPPLDATAFLIRSRPASMVRDVPYQDAGPVLTRSQAGCHKPLLSSVRTCTVTGPFLEDRWYRVLYGRPKVGGIEWFSAESERGREVVTRDPVPDDFP